MFRSPGGPEVNARLSARSAWTSRLRCSPLIGYARPTAAVSRVCRGNPVPIVRAPAPISLRALRATPSLSLLLLIRP